MPTTCVIDFDNNPMKVIYAGQLLRGTVTLTLTAPKSVRGVYIRIHGKAYAHWTEGTGDNRKTYTGSENYLDEKTYLAGGNGTNAEIQLNAGKYVYTFQCLLPAGLPTSVEGQYGHIRYMANVVLDIPMWPDKTFEVPFSVIKAIDLNAIPELREPVIAEKNKKFFVCCLLCCCESEPMHIVVRTPVGGYAPGQTINLQINVNNRSDQPVSDFTVQLIKKITYFIYANSGRQKLETVKIMEEHTRGCDVNQEEIINVNMELKPIPPTDSSTSNIIKVKYSIQVTGTVACFHSNPVLILPITIGSYPIQDNIGTQTMSAYPHPNTVASPIAPSIPENNVISQQPSAPRYTDTNNFSIVQNPTAPSAAFPFPNEDPPTYEEAIHMDDPDGNNFQPKYPMFKRTTSYSSGN